MIFNFGGDLLISGRNGRILNHDGSFKRSKIKIPSIFQNNQEKQNQIKEKLDILRKTSFGQYFIFFFK